MSGALRTGRLGDLGAPAAPAPGTTIELPTVLALGGLYRRALTAAARRAVPGRAAVPGAWAGGSSTGRGTAPTGALPDVAYLARGVRADADRLTAYQHLVGEPASDTLPAGFVHVLAFPVATALMVRDDFPLPLLGLVHLANSVEQRSPLRFGDVLEVRAWATGLRAHRSGTQVDLVTEVATDGATAWRGVSTYLAKGVRLTSPDAAGVRDDDETRDRPPFEPPVPTGSWRLPADTGRRYAAVSGDVNPIHLWAPAARAFGFHGTIAHGMFTAAKALAAVGAARGAAFRWSVDFAAPVVLPATVAVRVARAETGTGTSTSTGHDLSVWDPRRGRPHLTGSVRPLLDA